MKKDGLNVILVFIFVIGLSVMLYPTISNYWNARTQSRAIATYDETVKSMKQEDYDSMFQEAEEYNKRLSEWNSPYMNFDQVEGYKDILDVSGTGIMGYVTINKIRVELPIYHGTDDGILQIAAGHIEGSSLPTGGKGTHSVFSAHRGLPSAKLFTNLDKLVEGDTFKLTVLNRTLTYKVDQIRIVEPEEVDELTVVPEKDYCTLVTCTPYGINTHRLLVRGIRTANENDGDYIAADAHQIDESLVALAVAVMIMFFILIVMLVAQTIRWNREGK